MRPTKLSILPFLLALTLPTALHAQQNLTWDASGSNPAAPTAGSGTWSTSAANWSNGASDSAWVNGATPALYDSASFLGDLGGTNGAVALGSAISVNNLTFNYTSSTGSITYTVSGNTLTINGTISVTGRTTTISSVIGGTNGLTKTGNATLVLFSSSANTYTGDIRVQQGILQARGSGALVSTSKVYLGSITNNAATLDVRASQTIAGLYNIGTGLATVTNANVAATNILTINTAGLAGGDPTPNFSGVIRDNSGTQLMALTKTGAGVQILSGANTYSGATTINGGSLIVNGSLAAASAVTVGASGTLGGTGTAAGTVSVSGRIAAGESIGTLNTGALTINATGTVANELGRSGLTPISDLIVSSGGVTLTAGANLELTLFGGLDAPVAGDTFWLVSNNGAGPVTGEFTRLNGVATTLTEGSTFTWNSLDWRITYQANYTGTPGTSTFSGGNDIAIQAVPEPAAPLALGAVATAFLLVARRRRGR
jgi:autotransporter-associated beta strand protein